MKRRTSPEVQVVELQWFTDEFGTVQYGLFRHAGDGQLELLGCFTQGPFDTALEVGQWFVREIAHQVPPTSC